MRTNSGDSLSLSRIQIETMRYCGQQERYAPSPFAERTFTHGGPDAEDQQQRHEQAKRRSGLNPRRIIAALVGRCVLGDVDRGAAIFTPQRKALHQPQRDQHDRRKDAPGGKTGQHADEERAETHECHGDEEGVFAPDHIAEPAED
jgi:hypothetical protein